MIDTVRRPNELVCISLDQHLVTFLAAQSLHPQGVLYVSVCPSRKRLLQQIPALTSPTSPPIIRLCLVPTPFVESRAIPPLTATSISTTSSRGIARNVAAARAANSLMPSRPTGAPHSPSRFSSSNRPWTPGQS